MRLPPTVVAGGARQIATLVRGLSENKAELCEISRPYATHLVCPHAIRYARALALVCPSVTKGRWPSALRHDVCDAHGSSYCSNVALAPTKIVDALGLKNTRSVSMVRNVDALPVL